MRALVLLLLAACGGGDCEKLTKQCDACQNTKAKAACKALADEKNTDACTIAVDSKVYDPTGPSCSAPNL